MKVFGLWQVAVFGVLVTLVSAALERPCSASYECGPGECCLDPAMRKGKRQSTGYCKPRVANDGKCYVNNDKLVPSHPKVLYYDACPCQDGSSCKGNGIFEVPQGEQGTCKDTTSTKGFLCGSQSDCNSDECCVSIMKPIGRKRMTGGGVCEKRGLVGDSCLVQVTTSKDMNFACPCSNGLTCKGSGMFEIPLGERGTCTV